MISYAENPEDSTKKLLEPMNVFSKLKLFLYMNNKKKIKKIISYIMTSK